MTETKIFVNGFESKDNPYLKWFEKDAIPDNYIVVSKKLSKGRVNTEDDNTPEEDNFTMGNLILCVKTKEIKEGDN